MHTKIVKSTEMRYQVEANGFVHENLCYSLNEARKLARRLAKKGLRGVQIARYDRSGCSDYYEIIEVLA
jgi:hypothetical protein